ncbi:hypothetical protein I4U23_027817 [Adineta vaga]|nr:hypothetical protein I4U23_027817 [Adineta vaga]
MEQKSNRVQQFIQSLREKHHNHQPPQCEFSTDKKWLDIQFDSHERIVKPNDLLHDMKDPPGSINRRILNKIQGSLIGIALGDALGAHVEFRPRQYLVENPVKDLVGGGTWGLKKGQFTDDTSMTLCLAISLITRRGFVPYDQLVRYKWWYQNGYMSSTGQCFDIGAGTRQSLEVFINRQRKWEKRYRTRVYSLDRLSDDDYLQRFKVYCSRNIGAGNGALMRVAPVSLFFYKFPNIAIEYSGISGQITHGDKEAYDACRYYGALICAVMNGVEKAQLLDNNFYQSQRIFDDNPLCDEIRMVAEGSYKKKGGYDEGIRGKGYIVYALEAALWAFWSDNDCFEKGVLAAINLGDDTDTTAAIYGQLAGAYYGYDRLPQNWVKELYAKDFILNISKWLAYEGEKWKESDITPPTHHPSKYSSSCDNLTVDVLTRDYSRDLSAPVSEPSSPKNKSFWNRFLHPFRGKKQSSHSLTKMSYTPHPPRKPRQRRLSDPK